MVQKFPNDHRLDVKKDLWNKGIDYQPQLVRWIAEPSTVVLKVLQVGHLNFPQLIYCHWGMAHGLQGEW